MLGVLHHLSASGPLTLGELATHLNLSKATATELVTRVEERGLVDRCATSATGDGSTSG
jgi:DNA-binding MarR family transcriptional regulator